MIKYLENNPYNHIIHFTSSFDNLFNIITSNFLNLKYCEEELTISKAVHPMVCFSEQNINSLKEKRITYGMYGLSFNNNWIIKNNIQPVIYMDRNSSVSKSLGTLLRYRRRKTTRNKNSTIRLPIMTIKCFTKDAIGYNSHCNDNEFDFKSENEWRYVPKKEQIGGGYISETISVYDSNKSPYDSKIKLYPLKFKLEDINLIFVSSDEEKKKLMEQFNINSEKIKISEWTYIEKTNN